MPCRCDYMMPTVRERESLLVIGLLKEVGLIKRNFGMYGAVDEVDEHTAKLCEWCKNNDVAKYSLELQIWWRDHQKADAKRESKLNQAKQTRDKAAKELDKAMKAFQDAQDKVDELEGK